VTGKGEREGAADALRQPSTGDNHPSPLRGLFRLPLSHSTGSRPQPYRHSPYRPSRAADLVPEGRSTVARRLIAGNAVLADDPSPTARAPPATHSGLRPRSIVGCILMHHGGCRGTSHGREGASRCTLPSRPCMPAGRREPRPARRRPLPQARRRPLVRLRAYSIRGVQVPSRQALSGLKLKVTASP
jgi:hypothetical protein